MITIRVEDAGFGAVLSDLSRALAAGFPAEMALAGEILAAGIRANFDQGVGGTASGNVEAFAALSPRTLRDRRRRSAKGESLKGQQEQALVGFGGQLLCAATAHKSGVFGSAYQQSTKGVVVGVDGDTLFYAARAMGLTGGNPVRNPIALRPETVLPIVEIMRRGVAQKIRAVAGQ